MRLRKKIAIIASCVVAAWSGMIALQVATAPEPPKDYSNLGETVRENQAMAAELCPDSDWVKRDIDNRRNFCCAFAPNVYPAWCDQYGLRP